MQIKHALAALSLTAVLALAGCSGGGDASAGSDAGGSAASDAGQSSSADGSAVPEADVSDVPDPVAEVNGEEITKEQFVEVYQSQYQQAMTASQTTGQEVDESELRGQVADMLVDNLLLQQGAEEAGIEASDQDVDDTLDEIAAQNGMGSGDEVVQALVDQGSTEEQVREDAATQYELTAYVDQEGDISEPSDEEIQEEYDAQMEQLTAQGGDTSQVPDFEDVRDQLAQQMISEQEDQAASALAEELAEKGEVTVNL